MAVIKFKKETEGFSIQKDSQPKESFVGCSVQISCDSDSFVVMINNAPYYYEAAKHTFYINDVDVTGNTTVQISDSIRDDVTSGGSGGSGGGVILQSPDTTLWQLQINDAGVLVTAQVTSGTPGTLHLFSPDNTEWNVTVNNSGALETTAV
jgi:hypothetical protein